ncbi:transmembrane signal receptor [Lithospermum erythrorhizon]|uniref:Transmembrane signal receptor n=1 Tax=Lithospermum erythrorhizon TaxID=34254 RepID=A0AAV3R5J6_LITER
MITRSKAGVVKPKQLFSLNTVMVSKPLLSSSDPTSYSKASKFFHWHQAMTKEYNTLLHNKTWTLVRPDSSQNVIGCKWIFKTKLHPDGSIERHKARLVAQAFKEIPGLDYNQIFSLVIKPTTIRLILSRSISLNLPIRQLDIKNAFSNGQLAETVYLKQPPGFVHSDYPHHVCHSHKSLYGLKQAPRAWFQTFSSCLLSEGFLHNKANTSLFTYQNNVELVYLLVYVDDIIITVLLPCSSLPSPPIYTRPSH